MAGVKGQAGSKGYVHYHVSLRAYKRQQKRQDSIARSLDRFEMKKAMREEWGAFLEPDDPYLKRLDREIIDLRRQVETKTGEKIER